MRFIRHTALTGGTQVLQALSAMVGGILVARYLGPEARGTLATLAALSGISVLLGSLGVHQSTVYFVGRYKADRTTIVSNSTLFGLFGGVLTAGALALAGVVFHEQLLHNIPTSLFLLYICAVPFNYFNEFARRTALGVDRVALYNAPDLISAVGLLFGTAACIAAFGRHLSPLIVVRIGAEVTTCLILGRFTVRYLARALTPSRAYLRKQLGYGLKNYASIIFWSLLLQSDLVLCNHFLGTGPTGAYSVAVSLGLPVTVLGSVVGSLLKQRVSADEDPQRPIDNTNRVVRVLTPLALLPVAALAASAHVLVPALYGTAFRDAVPALWLLLPGLAALTLELVLMNYLAGVGSPPTVFVAPLVGLILNLGPNLYVIPRWGIDGAAATSSISYIIVLLIVGRTYIHMTRSSASDLLKPRRSDWARAS